MRFRITILSLLFFLSISASVHAQFPCIGGTTISTSVTGDSIDLCADVGSSTVSFDVSLGALPFGYMVLDENGIILYIDTENDIDFSLLDGETFQVYAFNYIGSIIAEVGDPYPGTQLASGCAAITANFITVSGEALDGGTVMTEDGETTAYICPGDSLADIVRFDSMDVSPDGSYTYIVTDSNNVILSIPGGDAVDFDTAAVGTCRVWGLVYTGNLNAMPGDALMGTTLADNCYALSGNFVSVVKQVPDGGTVMTEDGETEIDLCIGSGESMIAFDSMDVLGNFTYVVTDTNNVILSVPDGDVIDFENAGSGICRVWGLAYTGNITAMAGDTASAVDLTDGCFDLSDNFVTVNREETSGGTVSTTDGETEIFICVGDMMSDTIFFDSSGVIGNFTFVVTDTNNVILSLPDSNFVDFENAGIGICRVWGLAYTGDVLAMVGDTASAVALSDGCYALSENFVTVNRDTPNGGVVTTEDGENEVYICPGDGNPDIVMFDSTGVSGENYTYVITDTNNVILSIPPGDMNDFDPAGPGICRVWGLAYSGTITAMVGDTASVVDLSDGCFDLSDNFITVYREEPDAGTVQTEDGQTQVYTCPDDGNPDIIIFDRLGATPGDYEFIITDTNNVILAIADMEMFDFDSVGLGTTRVWGIAYTGNFTAMVGDTASAVNLSDACFDLSDNFITVISEQPEGGTVSTEDGETDLFICVGDGQPDTIRFDSAGVSNSFFTYVVTDTNNVILSLPEGDVVDFDGAGTGICRLWGLAYTGNVTAMVGDTASMVDLTDGCFDLSDNFVTVNRDEVSGGMVMTEDSLTEVFACIGDSLADVIFFDSTDVAGPNFAYVVTDTNNVILSLPGTDSVDFEQAGIGVCRVWGLAWTDSLLAMVGDTASIIDLSTGCFDLSDNYITVTRGVIDGGAILTEDSMSVAYTCPGDSLADILYFDSIGVTGPNFVYVVTDTNNVILSVSTVDSIDFEGAGIGVCRVWGLAYTGTITAMIGDTASAVSLTDGCFDLSNGFVTVYREEPDGGTVSTEDGETELSFCVGDGIADLVRFDSMDTSNSLYTYVVTDENNNILAVPGTDMVDFENGGGGICRVWGLAYTGNITAGIGDNAGSTALTDACFDLSDNFVTVIRTEVSGGSITTEDGETVVYTCPGDSIADVLYFDSSGVVGDTFLYVITDENNVILNITSADSVDFEGAGIGICRVWGLGYLGNLTAEVGDTASNIALSDSCYALSGNFVTVNRDEPDGGMVTTESGDTISTVCFTNGGQNILVFDSTDVSNSLYTYVVTDTNNVIISIPETDTIDFTGTGEPDSYVWGFAYTGNITAMVGDTITNIALSDECYDLSDNFVTVSKESVDGGMVMTEDGESVVYTCPGDGEADIVRFDTTGYFGDAFTYVVTDTNFVILSIPEGDMQDFEGAGEGVCLVWGLGYTGTLTAMVGDTASIIDLSDQCFDLSNNFITVYREVPDGGMVMTENGSISVTVTVGDSIPDLVFFDSIDVSNSLYTYVITDENNVILSIPEGDAQDFEGAGVGICRVWGLAYTGTLTAMPGDTADNIALSTACFDLSDNFITVERTEMRPAPGLPEIAVSQPSLSIEAWPNPVSDVLHLQVTTENAPAYDQASNTDLLQVVDLNGQVLISRQMIPESEIDVDVSQLPTGSYWLRYRTNGAVQTLHFVKQ